MAYPLYRLHTYRLSLLFKAGTLKEYSFDYLADPVLSFGIAAPSPQIMQLLEKYSFVKVGESSTIPMETTFDAQEGTLVTMHSRVVSVCRNLLEAFTQCVKIRTIAHYAFHKVRPNCFCLLFISYFK
jgi:hypothetical protein